MWIDFREADVLAASAFVLEPDNLQSLLLHLP